MVCICKDGKFGGILVSVCNRFNHNCGEIQSGLNIWDLRVYSFALVGQKGKSDN